MLYIILQISFIVLLMYSWNKGNKCFKILVMMQLISFLSAPFVGSFITVETPMTFFNIIFCFLNLYLIISPWKRTKFKAVKLNNICFFRFYKKILYIVLSCNWVISLYVLFIVYYFINDIALFKAQHEYRALYDTVPLFGILFRYAAISKYLGILALPICIFYISNHDIKQAIIAFFLSSSVLVTAIAFYSRAQMLLFILLCLCFYFYVEHIIPSNIRKRGRTLLQYSLIVITVIFTVITINRFTSPVMSFYGKRIPENSYIESQTLYSVFSYASQGFPNGIMQLEYHENNDVMEGEPLVYDLMMTLSYFKLTSWTKEDYLQRITNAYKKEALSEWNHWSAFHGYTCNMVKAIGYICTLLVDLLYYRYVYRKSRSQTIDIGSLSMLAFLLLGSINSIFSDGYNIAVFPLIFYLIISIFYNIIQHRIRIYGDLRI